MTLIQDYSEYLEALRSWKGQDEKPLHEIDAMIASIGSRFSEGDSNFFLYETPTGTSIFTVRKRGDALGVISRKAVYSAHAVELMEKVRDAEGLEWIKLCFFAKEDGVIEYESYYDTLPVSDKSTLTIGEVKVSASRIANELMIPESGILAISAPTYSFSPIVYALQNSGVKTLFVPNDLSHNAGVNPTHPIPVELYTAFGSFSPDYGLPYYVCIASKEDESESFVPGFKYKELLPQGEGTHYCLHFWGDCFGNEILQIKGEDGQESIKLFKEIQSY